MLCDCYSCKALILAHLLDTYSGFQGSDEKPGFFKYSIGFSRISFDWCVVRFRFFYERNDMIQGHLLDTSNKVIGCVEIFLERSEKQNHLQKRVFLGKFRTHFLRSIFKKIWC